LTDTESESVNGNAQEARRYPKRERKPKDMGPFQVYNVVHNHDYTPTSVFEALSGEEKDLWEKAMKEEYLSFKENDAWTLVDLPKGAKPVKSKWVFKIKRDSNGDISKYKARLVAKGFTQKYGIDYTETFSPVVRTSTLRMLMAIATELDLDIHHLDFSTAFLNGELKETVYMQQPEHFVVPGREDKVCLLKRSIYGLKQSSRMWNEKINQVLTSLNFKRLSSEPCVYHRNDSSKICIIALYVDDLYLFCSNETEKLHLIERLMSTFKMKDLGPAQHILGMRMKRGIDCLRLDQSVYIQNILEKFQMTDCKPVQTPLEVGVFLEKEKSGCDEAYPYQALIGSLMYLAVNCRPDIAHAVSYLSQFNCCYGSTHWKAVKRVLRYLKGTIDLAIEYKKTGSLDVEAYVDADWANDKEDRRSYTGFIFKLAGGPISWESRKQRTVALSSTEAEYMALSDGAKEAMFLKNILLELFGKKDAIVIYNDNQSAQKLSVNHMLNRRTKHIDIRNHFIRDAVTKGDIILKYQPTDEMPADILTKGVPGPRHRELVELIGIIKVDKH
jgi:hypothetical protein